MLRPTFALWFVALLVLLSACDSKPKPAPVPKPPAPAKAQPAMLGSVQIVEFPGAKKAAIEVILLPSINTLLESRIESQHEALEAMLAPPDITDAPQLMSESDAELLNDKIDKLATEFPPVRESTFTENGYDETYFSDTRIHEKYQGFINALNSDNLERGLNHIVDVMKADHAFLQEKLNEKLSEPSANQAQADINWLATFSEYFSGFKSVVADYDRKRLTYAKAESKAGGASPEEKWKHFQSENAQAMDMEVYRDSLGAVYADQNGDFRIDAVGEILVRVDVDGNSVYIIPAGPGGKYLWLDYSVVEIKPQTNPS
ncbi:MAG: hypothetical protein ACQKBV_02950 [Puniceicoccales bacterium]